MGVLAARGLLSRVYIQAPEIFETPIPETNPSSKMVGMDYVHKLGGTVKGHANALFSIPVGRFPSPWLTPIPGMESKVETARENLQVEQGAFKIRGLRSMRLCN